MKSQRKYLIIGLSSKKKNPQWSGPGSAWWAFWPSPCCLQVTGLFYPHFSPFLHAPSSPVNLSPSLGHLHLTRCYWQGYTYWLLALQDCAPQNVTSVALKLCVKCDCLSHNFHLTSCEIWSFLKVLYVTLWASCSIIYVHQFLTCVQQSLVVCSAIQTPCQGLYALTMTAWQGAYLRAWV